MKENWGGAASKQNKVANEDGEANPRPLSGTETTHALWPCLSQEPRIIAAFYPGFLAPPTHSVTSAMCGASMHAPRSFRTLGWGAMVDMLVT